MEYIGPSDETYNRCTQVFKKVSERGRRRTPETCTLPEGQRQHSEILDIPPRFGNDPSAGSPTETLLRLLLPLNDQV
jgi:hypothetical protein